MHIEESGFSSDPRIHYFHYTPCLEPLRGMHVKGLTVPVTLSKINTGGFLQDLRPDFVSSSVWLPSLSDKLLGSVSRGRNNPVLLDRFQPEV